MKLLVLDGHSIIHRAFYGIRMLTAPDGTPTNAVYGFLTILTRILGAEKPDSIAVAFDMEEPTFRHEQYDGYKATRQRMPDDLAVQLPLLKEVLGAMSVKYFELPGYEADDIIGTISGIGDRLGAETVIVTGDKDSFQLITDRTRVLHLKTKMGQSQSVNYDAAAFREEYGFDPPLMVDLKALMGDSSDNIPGVPGVGEKTALALIRSGGDIKSIYDNLASPDIKDSVRKKLEAGRESAFMSYDLAKIDCAVPLELNIGDLAWTGQHGPALLDIFTRLGFSRFIESWNFDLHKTSDLPKTSETATPTHEISSGEELDTLLDNLAGAETAALLSPSALDSLECSDGVDNYIVSGKDLCRQLLGGIADRGIRPVSHNVKDFIRRIREAGSTPPEFLFDAALAAYLIEPTESAYDIARISAKYLSPGDGEGAKALCSLYKPLSDKLRENGAEKLFYDIEMPLCTVLAEMELAGFLVDREALFALGESLTEDIMSLETSIWELVGYEFNISSPKQLGEALFEKLMLPHGKKTKTGFSTNAEVLEALRGKHPIIEKILDYRALTKLKSTYCDGLLKVIGADGRIHTSFQMTVTATGRLSSTEPNLQNIPVRTEQGSEIRRMFVAPPGYVLVDADYSQIELRLLAHISGDSAMIDAFLRGEDIHAVTASQVFEVALDEVTPAQRRAAKAVNFGIVYGISDFSLAQDLGVTRAEAKRYIDSYLEKYSGVRAYMKDIVTRSRADGYAETLFGRRRALPEITSSNFNIRSFGERVALNMPIQGTAADIMKIAMINCHRRLREENLSAALILQVHDELIVECPEENSERVTDVLCEEMERAASLSVPLEVDAHLGKNWLEAK